MGAFALWFVVAVLQTVLQAVLWLAVIAMMIVMIVMIGYDGCDGWIDDHHFIGRLF